MITYGSVCSGIEAASVAWHPLGWRAAWLSEIEPFPSALLAHHYPDVPNLGDLTKIARRILTGEVTAPDVLVGGTPCQAFSVAGLRQSLSDERGNLSLKYVELADAIDHVRVARGDDPAVIVWENVPGVLSTSDNAFGCFLGALAGEDCELQPAGKRWTDAGCVYGPTRAVAWRVLDAQFFGLAQRRRRVFVVASARAGFDPAAVLFERDGVRRDHPPRREAREAAAPSITCGADAGGSVGQDDLMLSVAKTLMAHNGITAPDIGNYLVAKKWPADVACTLNAAFGDKQGLEDQHALAGASLFVPHVVSALTAKGPTATEAPEVDGGHYILSSGQGGMSVQQDLAPALTCLHEAPILSDCSHTLRGEDFDASEDGAGRGTPLVPVAFQAGNLTRGCGASPNKEVFPTLKADHGRGLSDQHPCVAFSPAQNCTNSAVRRLTPVECSRLQGFPDDYLELNYANADEAHAAQVLHELWREAGTPAVEEQGWRTGIAAALLTPEILLAGVHVGWLSWEMAARCASARGALPGEGHNHEGFVRALRLEGEARRSPFGREPFEQLARELGGHLSFVPFEGAQARALLRGSELWPSAQARWPLRYALAKGKAREKPDCMNPDGPRYKALGNSMAVPVMRWIGQRIQSVSEINS